MIETSLRVVTADDGNWVRDGVEKLDIFFLFSPDGYGDYVSRFSARARVTILGFVTFARGRTFDGKYGQFLAPTTKRAVRVKKMTEIRFYTMVSSLAKSLDLNYYC